MSSHLIDNAPCPCLIVPYHYIGVHVDEVRSCCFELRCAGRRCSGEGRRVCASGVQVRRLRLWTGCYSCNPGLLLRGAHAPGHHSKLPNVWSHCSQGRDTADEEAGLEGSLSSPCSLPGLVAAGGSPTARDGLSVTEGGSPTAAGAAGAAPSTPSDLVAQLQRQLEEKDRLIAELRQQVHDLQLAAAQGRQSAAQDPAHNTLTL